MRCIVFVATLFCVSAKRAPLRLDSRIALTLSFADFPVSWADVAVECAAEI